MAMRELGRISEVSNLRDYGPMRPTTSRPG